MIITLDHIQLAMPAGGESTQVIRLGTDCRFIRDGDGFTRKLDVPADSATIKNGQQIGPARLHLP
jgi:hypothetical protein